MKFVYVLGFPNETTFPFVTLASRAANATRHIRTRNIPRWQELPYLFCEMAAVSDFFSLGSIVWCRTCYNKEVEGEVLAFDPQTKILILSILFIVRKLLFRKTENYLVSQGLPLFLCTFFVHGALRTKRKFQKITKNTDCNNCMVTFTTNFLCIRKKNKFL